MTVELHWGILGAGNISGQFVHDLLVNNSLETGYKHIIESIGSSTIAKGELFIKKHGIVESKNYGVKTVAQSYNDLYTNPKVNVIYIGTPHVFHKEQTLESLKNGKNVLCEKPFTINAKDAKELQDFAKEKNLFLMEAVWTRFFPSIVKLKKILFEEQKLGVLNRLMMDYSYDGDLENSPETSRVTANSLGGGSLLDIGIYCLTYARILLDDKLAPNNTEFALKSFQEVDSKYKVDFVSSMLIKYSNNAQAILSSSVHNNRIADIPYLTLQGSKGTVLIYARNLARPDLIKIYLKNGEIIEWKENDDYLGFIYEANAVADDISLGKITNDIVPPEETYLVMSMMDSIRKESGLTYEQDH